MNFSDPQTRGGKGGSRSGGGWFEIVVTTGNEVLSWQKRMREKARPFVKDTGALLHQDLSSRLPGWVILMQRRTSFWVVGATKIDDDQMS